MERRKFHIETDHCWHVRGRLSDFKVVKSEVYLANWARGGTNLKAKGGCIEA